MTDYATEQLKEIAAYIAHTLNAPETAKKLLNKIKKEISSLDYMPERYAPIEEEPWHTEGIRKLIIENFLVYYWTDEKELAVWVTAIIYGRRNQLAALKNMPIK